MSGKIFFALANTFVLATFTALGQDSSTASDAPSPDAKKPFQWTVNADGYTSMNVQDPSLTVNEFRATDIHSDTFRLNLAYVDLDYSTSRFGAHLDAGYGDELRIMTAGDGLKGANIFLPQYYVSFKPKKGSALQIDFGKFFTSVGAEVADANAGFNYSRSLLFSLGEPLYHFGLRATVPLTETFTAGVQVVNGWNSTVDNNGAKTLGFTTALTKPKWGWSQEYLVGPEKANTTAGERQLANEVFTLTPKPTLSAYVELLYGRDKRVGPGADAWYGTAFAGRWSATKKLSFAPRWEYYVDETGFTSGTPQHLHEATATAEYKLRYYLSTRLEFREDVSDQRVFGRGPSDLSRDQTTVMLAFLFSLKGER